MEHPLSPPSPLPLLLPPSSSSPPPPPPLPPSSSPPPLPHHTSSPPDSYTHYHDKRFTLLQHNFSDSSDLEEDELSVEDERSDEELQDDTEDRDPGLLRKVAEVAPLDMIWSKIAFPDWREDEIIFCAVLTGAFPRRLRDGPLEI